MSRFLWDVPDTVAPVAAISFRVQASVNYTLSNTTQTLTVTCSYDETFTAARIPVPWSGDGSPWGEQPSIETRTNLDFFVVRLWPPRKPNPTGTVADPAVPGLFPPAQRNVNCWIINAFNANPVHYVADGALNGPAHIPGTLKLNNKLDGVSFNAAVRAVFTDSEFPEDNSDVTATFVLEARATLNRVDAGRLVNGFGWDMELWCEPGGGDIPLPGATYATDAGTNGFLEIAGLCTIREASVGVAIHSVGIYTGEDGIGTYGTVDIPDLCPIQETVTGPATHSVGVYSQAGTPDLPASGSMVGSELQILLPTDGGGANAALSAADVATNIGTWSTFLLAAGTPVGAGSISSPIATLDLEGGTDNTPNVPASGSMVGDELQIILPTDADGDDDFLSGTAVIAAIAAWSGGLLTADTSTGSVNTTMAATPLAGGTSEVVSLFTGGDPPPGGLRLTALTERKDVAVHKLLLISDGSQDFGGTKTFTFAQPSIVDGQVSFTAGGASGWTSVDYWSSEYTLIVAVS